MSELHALQKAVEIAGGQSALARACGVRQGNVWSWLNRTRRIPPEYALKIEAFTGVSRHSLRPDIYPDERAA